MARSRQKARMSTGRDGSTIPCTLSSEKAPDIRHLDHASCRQGRDPCKQLGVQMTQGVDLHELTGTPAYGGLQQLAKTTLAWASLSKSMQELLQGTHQPYRLMQNIGGKPYTLVATQHISKGNIIGFYAGVVRTAAQWNSMVPLHDLKQLWSFDITDALKAAHGYDGPDLVVEASAKGNLTRFLQDACWWDGNDDDDDDGNNLQSVLYLVKMPGNDIPTPYVCFEALRDIKCGQEMLLGWGEGCWATASFKWVMRQAWHSWVEHITNQKLEAACRVARLDCNPADTAVQDEDRGSTAAGNNSRKRVQISSESDPLQKRHKPLRGASSGAAVLNMPAPQPCTLRSGMQLHRQHAVPLAQLKQAVQRAVATIAGGPSGSHVTTQPAAAAAAAGAGPSSGKRVTRAAAAEAAATRSSGCQQGGAPQADSGGFRLLTQAEVEEVFPGLQYTLCTDNIPEDILKGWQELGADDLPECSFEAIKWAQREAELIKSGRLDKACVVEFTDLQHSVRFCTPPGQPAYGLVAWGRDGESYPDGVVYQAGEPIGIYCGKLHLSKEFDELERTHGVHGGYVFGLRVPHELKEAAKQLEVTLPDMVVDNYSVGNESRYINCTWGTINPDECHNVSARVSFDPVQHLPIVVLYAQRDILWGEELLSSYGDDYWNVMARELQLEHARLHGRLLERRKSLEQLLRSKQGLTSKEWSELEQLAEQHAKEQVGPLEEELRM